MPEEDPGLLAEDPEYVDPEPEPEPFDEPVEVLAGALEALGEDLTVVDGEVEPLEGPPVGRGSVSPPPC